MKAVIQRVKYASVKIDGETVGACNQGFMILLGVQQGDTEEDADKLLKKVPVLRIFEDENGNTLVVRNSNYAAFRANILPLGTGSVVGVLSYYNTSATKLDGGTWQLYIRTADDCIGFSSSTKGLLTGPYTVEEAIAGEAEGLSGWVSGFVVGAVAPEVSEVKSADDIEWTAPTTLDNTLVIAPTADCRDISRCRWSKCLEYRFQSFLPRWSHRQW